MPRSLCKRDVCVFVNISLDSSELLTRVGSRGNLLIARGNAKRVRCSHIQASLVLAKLSLPACYSLAVHVGKARDAGEVFRGHRL